MPESEAQRACPRCSSEQVIHLTKVRKEGLVIDFCTSCGGLWLDREEWKPLVGMSRAVTRPPSIAMDFRRPDCPACSAGSGQAVRGPESPGLRPMGIEGLAGLEIDVCTACGGAWLDGGELKILQEQVVVLHEKDRREEAEAAAQPKRKVHAGYARTPEETMSFLEALKDTWKNLLR
jgi:Zn-finger nucleic acid-binding protein